MSGPLLKIKEMAEKENVDVRSYDVIYHALDDISKAMVGMLDPTFEEEVIGNAEVREVFNVPKVGKNRRLCGDTTASHQAVMPESGYLRDGVVVYTGKIESSLKRFQDDAKEVVVRLRVRYRRRKFQRYQSGRQSRGLCHAAGRVHPRVGSTGYDMARHWHPKQELESLGAARTQPPEDGPARVADVIKNELSAAASCSGPSDPRTCSEITISRVALIRRPYGTPRVYYHPVPGAAPYGQPGAAAVWSEGHRVHAQPSGQNSESSVYAGAPLLV
jgi:hypothetical protein